MRHVSHGLSVKQIQRRVRRERTRRKADESRPDESLHLTLVYIKIRINLLNVVVVVEGVVEF